LGIHSIMQLLLLIATFSPAAAFLSPPPSRAPSARSVRAPPRAPLRRAPSATRRPRPGAALHLFGFGEDAAPEDQRDLAEDELARYSFEVPADASVDVKFESLSLMIAVWAKLCADPEQAMGLTTPVTVTELAGGAHASGVQLLFRAPPMSASYRSKDDERSEDKRKEVPAKEGGWRCARSGGRSGTCG
jgi:hypothetical protein